MKHTLKRRLTSIILSTAVIGSCMIPSFANTPTKVSHHWANGAIEKMKSKGIIKGDHKGHINPDINVTRAEFVQMVNSLMGYHQTSEINFKDISDQSWYYDAVKKAVHAGYINGYSDSTFKPSEGLTREEAAKIITVAFRCKNTSDDVSSVNDHEHISPWAKSYVQSALSSNFMIGDAHHNFNGQKLLTKAEAIQILSNASDGLFNQAGEYTGVYEGNVIISTPDVMLKDAHIKGNLYIAEGVHLGDATLESVTVEGNTYILGGGSNSIHLKDVTLNHVILENVSNPTHVVFEGNSKTNHFTVNSPATVVAGLESTFKIIDVNAKDTHITSKGIIESLNANENLKLNESTLEKGKVHTQKKETPVISNTGSTNTSTPTPVTPNPEPPISGGGTVQKDYEIIKDTPNVANVYNAKGFTAVNNMNSVTSIHIMDSMTLTEESTKVIIIPKTQTGITLDLKNLSFSEVYVLGSKTTLKEGKIASLVIGENVEDIVLLNITDDVNSNHTFLGGGANSIKLLGNTSFEGHVSIKTAKDVRITSENSNAKIKGTVQIDSESIVRVEVPIERLNLTNSKSEVHINAHCGEIYASDNLTLTIDPSLGKPNLYAKVGKKLEVMTSTGDFWDVEVTSILDREVLKSNIAIAKDLLLLKSYGSTEKFAKPDTLDALKNALDKAEAALTLAEGYETTVENQNILDTESNALQTANETFTAALLFLNKKPLGDLVSYVDAKLATIEPSNIGDLPGQFSKSKHNVLLDALEKAKVALTRTPLSETPIEQNEVNTIASQLGLAQHDFFSNKITDTNKAQATFMIKGDIKAEDVIIEEMNTFKIRWSNYSSYPLNQVSVSNVEGGVSVTVPLNNLNFFTKYALGLSIKNNSYKAVLSGDTKGDVLPENKTIDLSQFRTLSATMSSGKSIPHIQMVYKILEGTGKGPAWHYEKNVKYPPGEYCIYANVYSEIFQTHHLYSETFQVNGENNSYTFDESKFVQMSFELEQGVANTISDFTLFLRHFSHISGSKLKDISSTQWVMPSPKVDVQVSMHSKEGEILYGLSTTKKDVSLLSDTVIKLSDDFSLKRVDFESSSIIEDTNIVIQNASHRFLNNYKIKMFNNFGDEAEYNNIIPSEHVYEPYQPKFKIKLNAPDIQTELIVGAYDISSTTLEQVLNGKTIQKGTPIELEISLVDHPHVKPLKLQLSY